MTTPLDQGSILCGVDNHEHAREAAGFAVRLARWLRLRLVLGCVVDPAVASPVGTSPDSAPARLPPWLREAALATGARLLEPIAEAHPLDDLHQAIKVGDPAEGLTALAAEEQAEMVVLGTRGQGALHQGELGGVASKLAGEGNVPVVLVPRGSGEPLGRWRAGGHVSRPLLCGLDGSAESFQAAVYSAALARRLGVGLMLVYVCREGPPFEPLSTPFDRAALLRARRRAGLQLLDAVADLIDRRIDCGVRLETGDAADCISDLAARESCALICVGRQGRGRVGRNTMGLGTVAKRLCSSAPAPVLLPSGNPALAWQVPEPSLSEVA